MTRVKISYKISICAFFSINILYSQLAFYRIRSASHSTAWIRSVEWRCSLNSSSEVFFICPLKMPMLCLYFPSVRSSSLVMHFHPKSQCGDVSQQSLTHGSSKMTRQLWNSSIFYSTVFVLANTSVVQTRISFILFNASCFQNDVLPQRLKGYTLMNGRQGSSFGPQCTTDDQPVSTIVLSMIYDQYKH